MPSINSAVTYRLLEDAADIDRVNAFYNTYYGKQRTRAQFEWEFVEGPAGHAIYVLALHEEQLVGTVCAIPFLWMHRGTAVTSGKVEDLLIDRAYRGGQVFQGMMALLAKASCERGLRWFWAFTYATRSFLTVGFGQCWRVNVGVFCIRPLQQYLHLSRTSPSAKWKLAGFTMLSALTARLGIWRSKNINGFRLAEGHSKDLEQLLQRNQQTYLAQTEGFMTWRLFANPYLSTVRSFELRDNHGRLVGHIAINIHPDGVAHWLQQIFDGSLPVETQKAFVRQVLTVLSSKCTLVRYWGFSFNPQQKKELQMMTSCGFSFSGRGIPFIWKDLSGNINPFTLSISRMASQGTV